MCLPFSDSQLVHELGSPLVFVLVDRNRWRPFSEKRVQFAGDTLCRNRLDTIQVKQDRISRTWSLLDDFRLLRRSGLALSGQVQHVANIRGGGHGGSNKASSGETR